MDPESLSYHPPPFGLGSSSDDETNRQVKRARRGEAAPLDEDAEVEVLEPPPMQVEVADARLQSVQILDGADAVLAGDSVQYVNLPRADPWVEDPIPNVDRLGRVLRVRVVFDAPGRHRFWARLQAGGDNPVYSGAELGHPAFRCDLQEQQFETGDDGTVVVDGAFVLPVGGGGTFWIAARDEHGTVAQSHRVVTQRLLYCQELVGAGTQPAPDIAGAVEQLAAANITLVPLPRGAMPARPNLDVESGDGQRAAFITDLDQAFAASPGAAKAPHVLTVAYLDRVTVQHKIKVTVPNVEAGGAATVVEIRRGGEPRYLWMGIDQTPWLTAASFTPDSGPAQDIKAHCTAVPNDHHYPDQCRNVRIALGSLPAGRGTVELYLVTVRKILGGVSFGTQTQRICVATRAGWVDVDPAKQQALVLHEIGHKLGLVPDGSGSLDRSPLQYDHTHTGSHCHWRLAPAAAYGPYEMGRCVMFGEALAPNQAFCQTCCDAARKADLSMGWTHS